MEVVPAGGSSVQLRVALSSGPSKNLLEKYDRQESEIQQILGRPNWVLLSEDHKNA